MHHDLPQLFFVFTLCVSFCSTWNTPVIKSYGFRIQGHNTHSENINLKRISYCSDQTITGSEAVLYSNISGTVIDQEVTCQWFITPSDEAIKAVYETYCNTSYDDTVHTSNYNSNVKSSFKAHSQCHNTSDLVIEIWLNQVLDSTETITIEIYALKTGSTTPTLVASFVGFEFDSSGGNQAGVSILFSSVASVILQVTSTEQIDSYTVFNATYLLVVADSNMLPSETGFVIATAVIVSLAFVGAVVILAYLKYQKEKATHKDISLITVIITTKPPAPSSWTEQRLVWIGHFKNPPSLCGFARLPPEVVHLITCKI